MLRMQMHLCRPQHSSTFDNKKIGASNKDSPVGQHVVDLCGALTASDYKRIDQCQYAVKLMTIESLHNSRRKPQLKVL